MKKLFLLLVLLGIVAAGCSMDEGGNIPDDAYISLNKDIVTISPDGESVDVKVYSNYAWELTNNCNWITTSITSGDASDTGLTVTLTADLTYDDRDGTIVFSCGKAKKLLVVSQKFKEAIIPDANNTFDIPAEGGHAVITYQTTVDCDVIIPEDAQSWITIEPATRGLISKSSTLNIAENTTYSARTAVVKVVAKGNAELAVEYTINQEQKNGVLADNNNTFNVSGAGGSVVIKYQANVDCEVIISDEALDWVTIAPSTRGLVTYNTTLNIAENSSGKERSCVIQVTSQGDNELSVEYTIIQNPRCFLYYTSNDGEIVTPYDSSAFGATILSNTYIDGVGVIEFYAPITTIGDYAFYECYRLNSVTIPDSVTTIGEWAFRYCKSLTSVTIPDSVTTIGNYAFWYCSSLTSVTIGNGVTTIGYGAFSGCSSLTSITIPDSVTTIGYGAFSGCSLTSITIPDSVTTIGDGAFSSCYSLTSVTIPDSVTTIGECAFEYCSSLTSVTIPDSVTTIGEGAFWGCSSLTSITIPDSATTIGGGAFYDCYSLTSVTIPDNVTTIGDSAFNGCYSLISVTIPDSVTTIGYGAFSGCSSLTSITIPDSVTTIGGYAFSDCLSLTSVTIPNSVTTIGECAFESCSLTSVTIPDSVTTIGEDAFRYCKSLTSITIPDSVTTIGYGAFWGCSNLQEFNGKFASEDGRCLIIDGVLNSFAIGCGATEYTIPDSVTTIGDGAFSNCISLTSVTIPDSVTTIGDSAFSNCDSLTSVTIPDSVTTIGGWAFGNCSNLTSVYCKAITPPIASPLNNDWRAFSFTHSGCKIYVPMESVNKYKSAQGWSSYKSDIVGYNF